MNDEAEHVLGRLTARGAPPSCAVACWTRCGRNCASRQTRPSQWGRGAPQATVRRTPVVGLPLHGPPDMGVICCWWWPRHWWLRSGSISWSIARSIAAWRRCSVLRRCRNRRPNSPRR